MDQLLTLLCKIVDNQAYVRTKMVPSPLNKEEAIFNTEADFHKTNVIVNNNDYGTCRSITTKLEK